jgi:translation initiation factor IF-2
MAEKVGAVLKKAMTLGMKLTINDTVDAASAELVVMEMGHKATREKTHDEQLDTLYEAARNATSGVPTARPPVITVMGHVDHGKTSLLDALRRSNVTAKEAGGITQHIGASQVTTAGNKVLTFIDTPGHAAFTAMRARGAHVTDIVILLVAADDSVKEQTVEAIHHAKASGAPIVVVINKIDKPEANPDRVRQDLLGHEIIVESMGGDIQDVEVSAQTGQGLDKLTEALLLQAELLELRADPGAPAQGTVLEAKVDRKRGVLATVLVQGGTLKPGHTFVAGTTTGRVRWMMNNSGQACKQAHAGSPVEIMGFSTPPMAGDDFLVTQDDKTATAIAELRRAQRTAQETTIKPVSALQALLQGKKTEVKELTIIVRADAQGSLEAVCGALTKIEHDEVAIKILHRGVGALNESDVDLAQASGALLLAFGVPVTSALKEKAKAVGVEVQQYDIIYKLVESIKDLLAGLLSPLTQEVALGKAEIRKIFSIKKMGQIAGCYVTQGVAKRNAMARVKAGNTLRFETTIGTLKREQSDVKEVKEGYECGIMFENKAAFEEGDTIEVFEMENIKRTLDDKTPTA